MSVSRSEAAKRREFGAFLRSRRTRLTPNDVGLNGGFRRRTPGLRREEVAQLAGVGTTWYTWLEQGRDVRASREVLCALANITRCVSIARSGSTFSNSPGTRPPKSVWHPNPRLRSLCNGCCTP